MEVKMRSESVNFLSERMTSMNFKPFNFSKKGSERLICRKAMLGLFLNGHSQKKSFPPFSRDWKIWTRISSFHESEGRSNSENKVYIFPQDILLQTSWENCLIGCWLLQFQEIYNFKSLDGVQVQSGWDPFFRCVTWFQESICWSFVPGLFGSMW